MVNQILNDLSGGKALNREQARTVMSEIMDGKWTPAQIAGLLMALKMKGETVEEITGFVQAMREKAASIRAPEDAVDTCGTGGDGAHSFNISTAAAIVAAAAGVKIAKHGNRSVSSKCGSADVLQELGVKIDLQPEQAETCLQETGIVFLFAPIYHASMKHAVTPRREMGIKTVFNILGPMSNPANTKRQVVGAYDLSVAEKIVQVLRESGSEHVLVVHSDDSMDEISLSGPTTIFELKNDQVNSYKISPEDFGLNTQPKESVVGGDSETNALMLRRIFSGVKSPHTDVTVLNAAAAIYVAGKASTLQEGIKIASEVIASGKAAQKLHEFVAVSNQFNGS